MEKLVGGLHRSEIDEDFSAGTIITTERAAQKGSFQAFF
jgi:hypothetical protein